MSIYVIVRNENIYANIIFLNIKNETFFIKKLFKLYIYIKHITQTYFSCRYAI